MAASLDVDHCLPWLARPCDELWNLMPADRIVNQYKKCDRLPSDQVLRSAKERIIGWWQAAYREAANASLADRFVLEAAASLPGAEKTNADSDDIFSAVSLQRLRLRHDQQVP